MVPLGGWDLGQMFKWCALNYLVKTLHIEVSVLNFLFHSLYLAQGGFSIAALKFEQILIIENILLNGVEHHFWANICQSLFSSSRHDTESVAVISFCQNIRANLWGLMVYRFNQTVLALSFLEAFSIQFSNSEDVSPSFWLFTSNKNSHI